VSDDKTCPDCGRRKGYAGERDKCWAHRSAEVEAFDHDCTELTVERLRERIAALEAELADVRSQLSDPSRSPRLQETMTAKPSREELFQSDLECARLSGMSEFGALEYAKRMAEHPSRGGGLSPEAIDFVAGIIEGHDLGGVDLADQVRAILVRGSRSPKPQPGQEGGQGEDGKSQ
jgi:uncharacterized small protein (DUF1192 family)